jgi:hypothetical protein
LAKLNDDRIKVTKENFGDLLNWGLEEVQSIRRGKMELAFPLNHKR